LKLSIDNQDLVIDLSSGAAITHLTLFSNGKQRVVISPQSGYHYESSFLFPFPNRLKNGAFNFEGRAYQFPLNDFGRPNAIHGFIHDKKFELEEQAQKSLTLRYSYSGDIDGYPFPFDLRVKYQLEPAELKIQVSVTNSGNSVLPYGFGWHPYFNIKEGVDQTKLQLKDVELIEVNTNMVPTGKKVAYKNLEGLSLLKNVSLDTCFQFSNTQPSSMTRLFFADNSLLEIWQDKNLPFVQVFTPPDRETIAIEPMSCNINALNTGDGLKTIQSNESWVACFGLRLKQIN
jgi:aldose 1-epimerase